MNEYKAMCAYLELNSGEVVYNNAVGADILITSAKFEGSDIVVEYDTAKAKIGTFCVLGLSDIGASVSLSKAKILNKNRDLNRLQGIIKIEACFYT